MTEAGLTHGTFYAHFSSGDELTRDAFHHALEENQPGWLKQRTEDWSGRLKRLARQYLSTRHRDDVGHGCPIGALASEAVLASDDFRVMFGKSVENTLRDICADEKEGDHEADAIALLALCVGGINLARAVPDEKLSQRILLICRQRIECFNQCS